MTSSVEGQSGPGRESATRGKPIWMDMATRTSLGWSLAPCRMMCFRRYFVSAVWTTFLGGAFAESCMS